MQQWLSAIGEERILLIETPKACIDVILGAIAITSGVRTMETYIKDMQDRQQSAERIEEVTKALKPYNKKFEQGAIKVIKSASTSSSINTISTSTNELALIKEIAEKLILTDDLDNQTIELFKALRKLNSIYPQKVPKDLLCPITQEIFFEPFMTCDGHTFEKKAIEQWFLKSDTSPVTNLKLNSKDLFPNNVVRKMVDDLYELNKNLI